MVGREGQSIGTRLLPTIVLGMQFSHRQNLLFGQRTCFWRHVYCQWSICYHQRHRNHSLLMRQRTIHFSRGKRPKMKSKVSPWFFSKIIFHISRAFLMGAVIVIVDLRIDGVILLDRTDKNGLPNGDTYAA